MFSPAELSWRLICTHAVTDYAWQSESMGQWKHPWSDPPESLGPWYWHLTAHGLINGLGVSWATGVWWIGILEAFWHMLVDYLKCVQAIATWEDQELHLVSKLLWMALTLWTR